MSHLHFDHAGGLLLADGSKAFPRATIVAQRSEWEIALGGNSRLVASYDQPEIRLVHDWGAEGWADGEREVLPGVSVVPTGGHSAGHQAIVVRGTGAAAKTLAFFGDLCMRPWAANPRWVTAFDDFPLDSVEVKGSLFARAADEGWIVVLSHEPVDADRPPRSRPRPLPLRARVASQVRRAGTHICACTSRLAPWGHNPSDRGNAAGGVGRERDRRRVDQRRDGRHADGEALDRATRRLEMGDPRCCSAWSCSPGSSPPTRTASWRSSGGSST